MKTKILMVLALFFMLSGFNGEDRIVEQNGVNLQTRVGEGVAPSFTQKPVIRQFDDGSRILIEVRFVADPMPSVTWYCNNIVLKESQNYRMSVKKVNSITYVAVLEIMNITSAQSGMYRVNIKNELGEANAKANVSFDNE